MPRGRRGHRERVHQRVGPAACRRRRRPRSTSRCRTRPSTRCAHISEDAGRRRSSRASASAIRTGRACPIRSSSRSCRCTRTSSGRPRAGVRRALRVHAARRRPAEQRPRRARRAADRHAPDRRPEHARALPRPQLRALPLRGRPLAGRREAGHRPRQPAESASTPSTTRSRRSRPGPTSIDEHIGPVARRDRARSATSRGRRTGATPIVGGTIRALKERATSRAALLDRVRDGLPGRVATIESFGLALGQLLHRDVAASKTVGWAKIPDAIGFGQRRTLSWDGGSEGPSDAIVIDADIAAGARIEWYVKHPWQGPARGRLPAAPAARPALPRADRRERWRSRGKALFEKTCAKCHGTYEDDGRAKTYVEKIVPIDYVDTDPARAAGRDRRASSHAANDPKLTLGLVLETTRRTDGYVPPVLTSVWARAPYGHAGPVAEPRGPGHEARRTGPTRFVVHGEAPLDLDEGRPRPPAIPTAPLGPGDYLQDGTKDGFHVSGPPVPRRPRRRLQGRHRVPEDPLSRGGTAPGAVGVTAPGGGPSFFEFRAGSGSRRTAALGVRDAPRWRPFASDRSSPAPNSKKRGLLRGLLGSGVGLSRGPPTLPTQSQLPKQE